MPIRKQRIHGIFRFGTKAETLEHLRPLIAEAVIPESVCFAVREWKTSRAAILRRIQKTFGAVTLAVRSSALGEDAAGQSLAGAFMTRLGVDGADAVVLGQAIDGVAASMTGDFRDQVLVQAMVEDIAVSGVIMTHDMVHGAPYYCIDYDDESGRTDLVTAGNGINKGLFVYRNAEPGLIRSPRVSRFLKMARELERVCGCPALDIEFGLGRDGRLYLFQVRRMALSASWHPVTQRRVARQLVHVERFVRERSAPRTGLLGRRTILAVMPDWNPAEIIGTTPRPLAASLYRELVTRDVWREARAAMGYRRLPEEELMVLINNHPYIDVRNSFNSFLPAALPDAVGETLVDAWLDRLDACPELHDKVEFEIVPTCRDFCFDADFADRYHGLLGKRDLARYRQMLSDLTRRSLAPGAGNTLEAALADAARFEAMPAPCVAADGAYAWLAKSVSLIRRCRELGTFPFAVVARHAFMAEALLRSAVKRGALTEARLSAFKRTIHTVTSSMVRDYAEVCRGRRSRKAFLGRYGHLRPGTYEITSLRYDERDDLFLEALPENAAKSVAPRFAPTTAEMTALGRLLAEAGLDVIDAAGLFEYARRAIAGREYVKFVFTRSLSDALCAIARWGEAQGLSHEDLSYIEWPEIERSLTRPVIDDADRHYLELAEAGRRDLAAAHAFRLGHIVRGVRDIHVATVNRSVPNFIGTGRATGQVVELSAATPATVNVRDRIVCIENADPGYDWIFTKGPRALVTQFGGANSHMAIRCAEFGLPAAIGCGEQIYRRVALAGSVELNCAEKILRPLHA